MKLRQYTMLIVSFLWLFPVFGQLPEMRLLLRELPFAAMADTLRKEGYAPVVQVHDSAIVLHDSSQLRFEYHQGRLCKASMRQATSRAAGQYGHPHLEGLVGEPLFSPYVGGRARNLRLARW